MVTIEDLKGMTFQQEVSGHTFEITGVDDAGNIIALSGTPSGVLLRADDQEVALSCSVSGGKVYATIPANGYAVPGKFGLTVFLTASGQTTALYAAIGSVNRTASGIVAPPAGSDVATLINQINAAIAAIPANYNACFAPTYSTSGLYAVGQYVMYDGYLYRCTTAITTGETFTPAHWTQVALANDVSDLKSALTSDFTVITGSTPLSPSMVGKYLLVPDVGNTIDMSTFPNYQNYAQNNCYVIPCSYGDEFTINGKSGISWLRTYGFIDSNGEVLDCSAGNAEITNLYRVAPHDSAYLIINDNIKATSVRGNSLKNILAEQSKEIDHVKGYFQHGENYFDPNTVTSGYWCNNGNILPLSGYSISDFIEVEPSTTYFASSTFTVNEFDEKKVYVGTHDYGSFTTDATTKYILLSINNVFLNTAYLIKGSAQLPSKPPYVEFLKPANLPDIPIEKIPQDEIDVDWSNVTNKPVEISLINLFNPATISPNKYIGADDGMEHPLNGWFATDFIKVEGFATVNVIEGFITEFYAANKTTHIKNTQSSSGTLTIPEGVVYLRTCAANEKLNLMQVGKNVAAGSYVPYGKAEAPDLYIYDSQIIKQAGSGMIDGYEVKFLLPDTIYLRPGENYSVYYNGAIKNYFALGDRFYVGHAKKSGSTYFATGETYDYKWDYTPEAGETFDIEFRIIEKATATVITSKVIHFVTSATKSSKTMNAVIMGDSFVDGYNIVPYLVQQIAAGSNTLDSLGVNSTDFQGIKDCGWAGQTWNFVTHTAQAGLRSDRPLSDANWDAGWGEGEEHGWTAGETYADLTPEQRSHGHTRNEFWNPSTSAFDFSYYMSTYQPGKTCDVLISEYGLNDIGWMTTAECIAALPTVKANIDTVIASAKAYNANIKILLYTIVPNDDDDNTIGSWWAFSDNSRVQQNCMLYNEMLLENYGNDSNVIILGSSCNFDNRYGFKTKTYKPVKFDQSIEETHSEDIHPSVIGAKYIADSMANAVYYLMN
jgi:hypothetical protein